MQIKKKYLVTWRQYKEDGSYVVKKRYIRALSLQNAKSILRSVEGYINISRVRVESFINSDGSVVELGI